MGSDQQEPTELPELSGYEGIEPLAALFVHKQFEDNFKEFCQNEFNSTKPILEFLISSEVNKKILNFEMRAVPDMKSFGTNLYITIIDWSRCNWYYIKKLPLVKHSEVFENEMTYVRSALNNYLKK